MPLKTTTKIMNKASKVNGGKLETRYSSLWKYVDCSKRNPTGT
uniref:Uncharacterized protein n=1 Tax=Arundo donax TaxID=35708 RepID=A0A0A9FNJ3_ARUDO